MDLLGDDSSAQVTTTSSDRVADPMTSAPPLPPPPPPKVTSTENLSIDDVTGLSDWGPRSAWRHPADRRQKANVTRDRGETERERSFRSRSTRGRIVNGVRRLVNRQVRWRAGGGKLSDPLGGGPPSKPSDGWGRR